MVQRFNSVLTVVYEDFGLRFMICLVLQGENSVLDPIYLCQLYKISLTLSNLVSLLCTQKQYP